MQEAENQTNNQSDRIRVLSDEHILICLSSSPSNAKIIQTAGKMAKAYHGKLTALFVETPAFQSMEKENRERLHANFQLAKEQGAILEQVSGEDIPFQIAEFARLNGVTKIVIGRSNAAAGHLFGRKTLTDQLIAAAPNTEVFIIPDGLTDTGLQLKQQKKRRAFSVQDTVKMLLLLTGTTLLGLLLNQLGFTDANIVTIYILGVLITSVVTDHIGYGVAASILSVFTFNYFFTEPRYTLLAYDIGYPMTFLVMFLASLLTGTSAGRLKGLAKQSSQQAYRTKILLDTNQVLQQAGDREAIWKAAQEQLSKLTGRKTKIYLAETCDLTQLLAEADKKTELRYPVQTGSMQYGVVGIDVQDNPMDVFENSIVLSILGECALSLENEKNASEKEQAAILAQNEQLRANLLRTISHDLRTPLTSISGNASNLMTKGENFSEETKQQLYTDIYDDSMWLISLVENLLSVTRMEGNGVQLRKTTELLDEIVAEALRHLDRKSVRHTIRVENPEEFLMVRVDAKLIIQVLINLVNNGIKYTQDGSEIIVRIRREQDQAVIAVSDNGPGISDERKQQVFELFYSGENPVTDGHRSMGLGLALCRSIILAHGGTIWVEDSRSGGACFMFTLPIEEVKLHE